VGLKKARSSSSCPGEEKVTRRRNLDIDRPGGTKKGASSSGGKGWADNKGTPWGRQPGGIFGKKKTCVRKHEKRLTGPGLWEK